jgi:heterodisulfide reductase subunit A-like polyferredoxin
MIYEKQKRYIIPFDDVPAERAEMPEISVDERRGNFVEVETGFPEEEAVREAKRCLACRRCLGCALCWAECKPEAIDFSIPDETFDFEFDEVVITRGQDNAFEAIGGDLGFGNYADVITDLQFERMLSPTGPTDGLVISPKDGEVPEKLAIIQGAADGGDNHLLSSAVLGVNEAIIALNRARGLEAVLVSPITDAFRDKFGKKVDEIDGLRIVDGAPRAVERKEEGGRLTLTYTENDREDRAEFDMVVVLTKPNVAREVQSLARKLEQDVI